MKAENKKHAKQAAQALAQLHVFAAVQAMLEGGTIIGGGSADKTAGKIIALCKTEMGRQLNIYDTAIEKLSGPTEVAS